MKSELQTTEKGKFDWFAVYLGSPRFSIACRELKMRRGWRIRMRPTTARNIPVTASYPRPVLASYRLPA